MGGIKKPTTKNYSPRMNFLRTFNGSFRDIITSDDIRIALGVENVLEKIRCYRKCRREYVTRWLPKSNEWPTYNKEEVVGIPRKQTRTEVGTEWMADSGCEEVYAA